MRVCQNNILLHKDGQLDVEVTLCISLYNYENYIVETLDSVEKQDLRKFNLIIVDDHSTDNSARLSENWLVENKDRFNSVRLIQHTRNNGLAASRNTAFALCHTDFVFVLDADNSLYTRCLSRCLEAIKTSGAEFVYPTLDIFGERRGLMGTDCWSLDRLKRGNYIDAMSLVRHSAWKAVGGYSKMKITGWEDYDFWCKFAEHGFRGTRVPEILARYRTHRNSMLSTITNRNVALATKQMLERHPWLDLPLED